MTTTEIEPFQQPRPLRMAMGALEDPEKLGRLLAASGYFNDTKDAAQAVVKVLAGAELGFGPIASMTGIYIVKGNVTMSANLMASQIKRWRPRYDYKVRDLTNDRAVIAFYENGEETGTSEFTMADARTAGLTGSDTWKKYPRNMLFARAMSNGAGWYCPDAFAGGPVYTPDELGADIDPETGELRHVDTPAVKVDVTTGEVIEPHSAPARETPAHGEPAAADTEPSPSSVPPVVIDPEGDANADDPVTADEVAKLTELLDTLNAPASFRRMALMTYGADELDGLSKQQAAEVADKALARFGS